MLVQTWREIRGDGVDKQVEAAARIERAVDSSLTLRSKKDLILAFVDNVSASGEVDDEWRAFIAAKRTAELDEIITEEGLSPNETRAFVDHAFRDGAVPVTGTAITSVLPPVSRFSADGSHGEKKQHVIARLEQFFERFWGLSGIVSSDAEALT
jgi:type I restriction enzyme, R subunit